MNDTRFDDELAAVAWRRFAEEDAHVVAPAHLERQAVAAWRASCSRDRERRARRSMLRRWSVAAAAAMLLLAMVLDRGWLPVRSTSTEPGAAALRRPPATRTASLPSALVTLAADPLLDTETLHLVRVRMPRSALRAMGIMVGGPDATALVDVDVLIGEDGLPRDVRRVLAVQE
jgi:hypothetical protein